MVHYRGIVPAFHIKNKLEFWRSISHKLIKIETSNFSHTYICGCVVDQNKIHLCSNMFVC